MLKFFSLYMGIAAIAVMIFLLIIAVILVLVIVVGGLKTGLP